MTRLEHFCASLVREIAITFRAPHGIITTESEAQACEVATRRVREFVNAAVRSADEMTEGDRYLDEPAPTEPR